MKVLYMLRHNDRSIRVHSIKWETPLVPLDFSDLKDTDLLYIVGHGDQGGLYPLGPNAASNQDRLVEILTKDGSLKKKRKGQEVIIGLLSCRAGLGLHKALARKLYNKLRPEVLDVLVAGAKGFTFGSIRTFHDQQNEVLIKGLPWYMEYPMSIKRSDAERETSAREGRTVTYRDKRKEIIRFQNESSKLEYAMKDIIQKLKSTEVNKALNELQSSSDRDWWLTLIWQQQLLYTNARNSSGLGFDMWYSSLAEAYVVASGKSTSDHEVASILAQVQFPGSIELTSVK